MAIWYRFCRILRYLHFPQWYKTIVPLVLGLMLKLRGPLLHLYTRHPRELLPEWRQNCSYDTFGSNTFSSLRCNNFTFLYNNSWSNSLGQYSIVQKQAKFIIWCYLIFIYTHISVDSGQKQPLLVQWSLWPETILVKITNVMIDEHSRLWRPDRITSLQMRRMRT